MRITDVAKQQHRELEELIRQLETAEDDDERLGLREELADVLAASSLAKLEILYPLALDRLGPGCRARESAEETAVTCFALERLMVVGADDVTFSAKLGVLKDVLMNHIEEDECELLPQLDSEVAAAELDQFGDDISARFDALMRESRNQTLSVIAGRVPPPVQKSAKRPHVKRDPGPPKRKKAVAKKAVAKSVPAKRVAGVRSHGDPADLRAKRGSGRATKNATKPTKRRDPIPAKGGTPREVVTRAATATQQPKKRAAKK